MGFTATSLPVGESSHDTVVEEIVNERLNRYLINLLCRLSTGKRIVEFRVMVLNVLGDSVNLVLWLSHSDYRVRNAHAVYLPISLFLLENGSLAHAHTQTHVASRHMRFPAREARRIH